MRNLISFLVRFHSVFLFLFLEIFAFSLIFRYHNYQQSGFISTTHAFSAHISGQMHFAQQYLLLRKTNEALAAENARLRELLPDPNFDAESPNTPKPAVDSLDCRLHRYISAQIINQTTTKLNNYLTINRGQLHGVKKQMGVVGPEGIAGIVNQTSDRYATALSVLHKNFRASVRIQATDVIGTLTWNGKDPQIAQIEGVASYASVKAGDQIITSGFSQVFPPSIPVGEVVFAEIKDGYNFYTIHVKLATNFSSLKDVYLTDHIHKDEIQSLEVNNE